MENTTTISNQVLNVGDYVKTSKGNIGVLVSVPRIEIGYYTLNAQSLSDWMCLQKFHLEQRQEAYDWCFNQLIKHDLCIQECNSCQVLLGKKEYTISPDKLTKLSHLTIITQQGLSRHHVKLPAEDAKLLMEIYSRNNIWHCIV
jgi:hypothetical protein